MPDSWPFPKLNVGPMPNGWPLARLQQDQHLRVASDIQDHHTNRWPLTNLDTDGWHLNLDAGLPKAD